MRHSKTGIQAFLALAALAVALLAIVVGCEEPPEPRFQNPYENHPYWYKGQVHSHSVASDGDQSPYDVEVAYQRKGYTFICLTDHNSAEPDPDALGIVHITSGEDGYGWRHHILALGINLEKVEWYHDNVDPDRDSNQDGLDDRATRFCENIQPRIDYITEVQETIAVLAHPTDSHAATGGGFTLDELKENSRYTGIEIYNAGGPHWSDSWWDEVLSMGRHKRMWGFAGDDCHDVEENHKNFNRGWIVVNSRVGPAREYLEGPGLEREDELRQDILENIKAGNFYSVVRSPQIPGESPSDGPTDIGPQMEIKTLGDTICVYTDQKCEMIRFRGESSRILDTKRDVTDACYKLDGSEHYVRIVVEQRRSDGELYMALSQPLYVAPQGPSEFSN